MAKWPSCEESSCLPRSEPTEILLRIQVNGESQELPDGSSVEYLVRTLSLEPVRIAIELNRSVVRRNEWANTTLHESDRIEIVHFVGGG